MKLRLLSLCWRLAADVAAWLGRRAVREMARRDLIPLGWDGRRLVTMQRPSPSPLGCPSANTLPSDEWPECDVWTTGLALGREMRVEEA